MTFWHISIGIFFLSLPYGKLFKEIAHPTPVVTGPFLPVRDLAAPPSVVPTYPFMFPVYVGGT